MGAAAFTPVRLEDLVADVLITTPSSGEVLKWNGSAWVNGTVSAGSPGGSAGQLQYHGGVTFAGAAFSAVATSGALLTLAAQASTDTPLTIREAASQSAYPLQVCRASDGFAEFRVTAGGGGYFDAGVQVSGSLNVNNSVTAGNQMIARLWLQLTGSVADTGADNGSIYFSTDANKLVYKDSGGAVHALY